MHALQLHRLRFLVWAAASLALTSAAFVATSGPAAAQSPRAQTQQAQTQQAQTQQAQAHTQILAQGQPQPIPVVPHSYGGPPPPPVRIDRGPSMLELTDLAIDMVFLLGGPPASTFDQVLIEHGFGISPLVFGIDLDARHRLWKFVWLGGRVALRERSWAAPARDPATAFALTGLALVAARIDLARTLDIGVVGGLGAGPLALTMNGGTDVHFALHVHAGLEFAFTLTGPLRGLLRAAWDYDRATVNDYGHEVRLGGFSFGVGVEARQ